MTDGSVSPVKHDSAVSPCGRQVLSLDRYVLCNYHRRSEHAVIGRYCTINYGGGVASNFEERP